MSRNVSNVVDEIYDTYEECESILKASGYVSSRHTAFLIACCKILALEEELISFVGVKEAHAIVTLAQRSVFASGRDHL